MADPGERRSLKELLSRVERKAEALIELGAETGPVLKRVENLRSLVRAGKEGPARLAADELLIFLKIITSEVDRIIQGFTGEAVRAASRPSPEVEESDMLEAVGEAFQRCLHSSALRRMVETIALEKVQTLLTQEYVTREELEEALGTARVGGARE
jgi:hypothetical protein